MDLEAEFQRVLEFKDFVIDQLEGLMRRNSKKFVVNNVFERISSSVVDEYCDIAEEFELDKDKRLLEIAKNVLNDEMFDDIDGWNYRNYSEGLLKAIPLTESLNSSLTELDKRSFRDAETLSSAMPSDSDPNGKEIDDFVENTLLPMLKKKVDRIFFEEEEQLTTCDSCQKYVRYDRQRDM